MEDIAPGLLDKIRNSFIENIDGSSEIGRLYRLIQKGTATYADAEEYAFLVGKALSQAFGKHLASAALPDGRMYYNIADRVIRPLLEEDHNLVADAAMMVQKSLNQSANIGLKAQSVAVNTDRIDGIIDKVSNAASFDDVAWVLDAPVKNFSMNVVDEVLKANVDFQGKAGRHPRIIRKAERKCCEWCSALAGEYEYPMVPDDVYRRHENCRCTVEYDPGDGHRQNIHTKRLTAQGDSDTIEARKRVGLDNIDTFKPREYAERIRNYAEVDRAMAVEAAKAGKRHGHSGVYADAKSKSKKQLQKSIVSRFAQVERHAEKIQHPEKYILDWDQKDPRYQAGLIRKWEKDLRRNAEQAEIELAVFEERF